MHADKELGADDVNFLDGKVVFCCYGCGGRIGVGLDYLYGLFQQMPRNEDGFVVIRAKCPKCGGIVLVSYNSSDPLEDAEGNAQIIHRVYTRKSSPVFNVIE